MSKKPNLRVVKKTPQPPLDMAGDIYADVRAAARDSKRWARMHVAAHRRAPLDIFQPPHKRSWRS